MADVTNRPLYQIINGVRCAAMFSPQCFREALNYKPRDDDTFIVTYPKCGTTWAQNILMHIFRKGKPLEDYGEFPMHCPFIDLVGLEAVERMPRPNAIKTHLPYTHMPYSPHSKYIFVTRNPRDVCVSMFYHTKTLAGFGYHDGKFDDFFELFMKGEVEYDDYFDHLLSWYPHRNDKNVCYSTYEQMKVQPKTVIRKFAKFLGNEYIDAIEKDNSVMNSILHHTSFQFMKDVLSDDSDEFGNRDKLLSDPKTPEGIKYLIRYTASLDLPEDLPSCEFIRKGIVGD